MGKLFGFRGLRRVALGILALVLLVTALPVLAHQPELTGNVTCGSDGVYHLAWSAKNSENRAQGDGDMTFTASRGSFDRYRLGRRETAFAYEDLPGSTSGTISLVITANWPDLAGAPVNVVRQKDLILKGDCAPKGQPTVVPTTPAPTAEPTIVVTTPAPTEEATLPPTEVTPTEEVTQTEVATEVQPTEAITDVPTEAPTEVTPVPTIVVPVVQPQPTAAPVVYKTEGTGFFICAFSLQYAENPFGGDAWGIWLDEMSHFGGFIVVAVKDGYVDVALHTSQATRSSGPMNVAGPSGFNLDVLITWDEVTGYACYPNVAAPAASQPEVTSNRPIPASGSSERPANRPGNNAPLSGSMPPYGVLLIAGLVGGIGFIRRAS